MNISIVKDAGPTAVVSLEGRLDLKGVDVVAPPLGTLSESKDSLLIEMSGVTFIASVGVRQLLSASAALTRRGGRLVLLRPTAAVVDILVAAGVADFMKIVRGEGEAAAALASVA